MRHVAYYDWRPEEGDRNWELGSEMWVKYWLNHGGFSPDLFSEGKCFNREFEIEILVLGFIRRII